jgi:hypothetical protein
MSILHLQQKQYVTPPAIWKLVLTRHFPSAYFYHGGKESQWEAIKKDDVRRYRNAMVSHLKDVEASGDHLVWTPDYLKDHGGSVKRGIILTGGEGVSFQPTTTLPGLHASSQSTLKRMQMQLDMLRNVLDCKLPIELYHFPDEMQDPEVRKFFVENFDVELKTVRIGSDWSLLDMLTILHLSSTAGDLAARVGVSRFTLRFGCNTDMLVCGILDIKNAAFVTSDFTEFIYMDSVR